MELAPSQALRDVQHSSGDGSEKHRGGTGSRNEAENISRGPSTWFLVTVLGSIFLSGTQVGNLGVSLKPFLSPSPCGAHLLKSPRPCPFLPSCALRPFRVSALTVWMGAVASASSPFHTPCLCSTCLPEVDQRWNAGTLKA